MGNLPIFKSSSRRAGALVLCGAVLLCSACNPGGRRQAGPNPPLAPSTAYHLYVAPNGNDTNAGSAGAPFLTIARASMAALPDTTIHVATGDYPGGFVTRANGNARDRVYYVATTPGTVRIVPPLNSTSATAWENRGNHVDIVGFEIDGSSYRGGARWVNGLVGAGSFDSLRHNVVHHIGRGDDSSDANGACPTADGAGIVLDSLYKGVQNEAIGNKVYDIGPPFCATSHGIAVHTSALVANNLVFRNGGVGIRLWRDAHHVLVRDNTVAANGTGIVVGGGNFYLGGGLNDFTEVSNNIVYDNQAGIVELGATGKHNSYRNNLVSQHPDGDWKLAPGGVHLATVAVDPRFTAYKRTGMPDFTLADNSPAIGKGDQRHAHAVDYRGTRRDSGRVDLGAIQHGVLEEEN